MLRRRARASAVAVALAVAVAVVAVAAAQCFRFLAFGFYAALNLHLRQAPGDARSLAGAGIWTSVIRVERSAPEDPHQEPQEEPLASVHTQG